MIGKQNKSSYKLCNNMYIVNALSNLEQRLYSHQKTNDTEKMSIFEQM